MVLRAVDVACATLTFFTDARAAKLAALNGDARVAVVAYDPVSQTQLRLRGAAAVATDGAAVEACWATVPVSSRRAYATTSAPGSAVPTADVDLGGDARANFAVLTVFVDEIDRLDLAGPQHVRVAFRRDGAGWRGGWRVP